MGLSLGKGVGGWKRGEVDSDSFFYLPFICSRMLFVSADRRDLMPIVE